MAQTPSDTARTTQAADLVAFGKAYTSEYGQMAEAFAVRDGRYVYVGDKAGAQAFVEEGTTEVVDHTGCGLVMPSCGNGHARYPMGFAIEEVGVVVGSDVHPEEFLSEVAPNAVKRARETGATSIFGFGWNMLHFQDNMPTRQQLDAICADIPHLHRRQRGSQGPGEHHLPCQRRLHDGGRHGPQGGQRRPRRRDRDGLRRHADGLPEGDGRHHGTSHLDNENIHPVDAAKSVMSKVQRHMLSEGYTMFVDGWTNYFYNNTYEAARQLDEAGDIHVLLGLNYELESWMDLNEGLEDALDSRKYASRHVMPRWVKLFIDGTVGTGIGYVDPLYPDGHQGEPTWTEDEVTEISRTANSNGMSMHVRTMGNKAVSLATNGFVNGGRDEMRNTLVHVRNIDEPDLRRMADHNIYVTGDMHWHHGPAWLPQFLLEHNGSPKGLEDKSYPMRSFIDHGVNLSSHTDYPALSGAPDDPFGIIEIAVTGVLGSEGADPWWPEELVTRDQALAALTINVARQMFEEDERGSIREGKYADFILVDKDVLDCPVREIHEAKAVATYFEGERVFSR